MSAHCRITHQEYFYLEIVGLWFWWLAWNRSQEYVAFVYWPATTVETYLLELPHLRPINSRNKLSVESCVWNFFGFDEERWRHYLLVHFVPSLSAYWRKSLLPFWSQKTICRISILQLESTQNISGFTLLLCQKRIT